MKESGEKHAIRVGTNPTPQDYIWVALTNSALWATVFAANILGIFI